MARRKKPADKMNDTGDTGAACKEDTAPSKRTLEEQALVVGMYRKPHARPPKVKADTKAAAKEGQCRLAPDGKEQSDHPLWLAKLGKAFGTQDTDLALTLLSQTMQIADHEVSVNCERAYLGINAAIAAIDAIGPQDVVESMLAAQMVGTHNAAMRMLARLTVHQPLIEVADSLSNRANKLMRTFAAQVEALNRHRSRGKQQIVVQHVHVTADKAAIAIGSQPGGMARGVVENGGQSHEKRQIAFEGQQVSDAQLASLRSAEQERQPVPVPRDAEWTLPSSRRDQSGSAKG